MPSVAHPPSFPQRPLLQTPGRGNALLSFRQIPLTFLFSFSDGIIRSILSFPMGSKSLLHGLTGSLAHNCFSLFPSPHPRLLSVLFCNNSPTHRSKVAMDSLVGLRGQRCPQRSSRTVPAPTNYLPSYREQGQRAARLDGNDESPPSGGLLGIGISLIVRDIAAPVDGLTPRNVDNPNTPSPKSTTIPTGLALLFVAQLTDYCKSRHHIPRSTVRTPYLLLPRPPLVQATPTRFDTCAKVWTQCGVVVAFSNVFASHPITPALPKNTRSYVFGPPAVVPAVLADVPPCVGGIATKTSIKRGSSIHTDPLNGRPSSKCMWADSPIIIEGSGFKNPDSIVTEMRIDVSIVLGEISLLSFVTTTSGTHNTHALSIQPQSTSPTFDLHTLADSFVRNTTDIQCQIRGPFESLNAHLLRGPQAYQEADVTCHLVDEMRGRSVSLSSKIGTCPALSQPPLPISWRRNRTEENIFSVAITIQQFHDLVALEIWWNHGKQRQYSSCKDVAATMSSTAELLNLPPLLRETWLHQYRLSKHSIDCSGAGPKHESKQVYYFAYSMTTYHQRRVPCGEGTCITSASNRRDVLFWQPQFRWTYVSSKRQTIVARVLNKDYNYSVSSFCYSDSWPRSKSQVSPILKLNRIYERSLPQSPDHLHRKHQNLAARPVYHMASHKTERQWWVVASSSLFNNQRLNSQRYF
ncbi:uncharacterized protein CLUP02_08653 [Colletotrichum lupini]|uniref:Uncharacterized protein n=1 Tax=Colletotrichum lupini TaxID=145971 RepID=A0A9Q8ST74_9PEZI|nr:uncharacterized protein CLUP02_08653 [Colletotrichum lupini]UQC83159.1 hypothetical protein CLUP02_08653 [Colletotrichum lupini]